MFLLLALCLQVQAPDAPQQPDQPPVSLERIRRGLERPELIPADEYARPFFRIEIQQEAPSLEWLWRVEPSPVPAAPQQPLYHQEVLSVVTPQEFRTGTVNPIGTDVLPYVSSAFRSMRNSLREGSEEQVRKNVQRELEMLRDARRAAGLPDR